MFFPKTVGEIASAVRAAEADNRPLRAVGGGWSFSDAALPGTVITNRPSAYGVDALSAVLPHAERFPADKTQASVAAIVGTPAVDGLGSMVMLLEDPNGLKVDRDWLYLGAGNWTYQTSNSYLALAYPDLLNVVGAQKRRPIRNPGPGMTAMSPIPDYCLQEVDTAGSLVMFDLASPTAQPSRDWFYNGMGVWTVGISEDSRPPYQGNLLQLSQDRQLTSPVPGKMNLSPRAARANESLALLLSKKPAAPAPPEPVYVMNTRSLVSSLQQDLPSLLSSHAKDATSEKPSNGKLRRYLFHVEAGITISELGPLLAHQSPRLTLQAISGSPGATLGGAISTGTHGAEFNWPPLIDRVKAVHLVGPCGLEWWIEGEESIADPTLLQKLYPSISSDRIISGTKPVQGIVPQDWLNAVVVSMGSMGVLYSIVLEAFPLFGVHEVVVRRTWHEIGFDAVRPRDAFANQGPGSKDLAPLLRDPQTRSDVSNRLVMLLQDGTLNGTFIPQFDEKQQPVNQYADLAINPNIRVDGDFDCWIGNREMTLEVPLDPNPSDTNETVEMLKGLGSALTPDIKGKLQEVYGYNSWNPFDIEELTRTKLNRITRAADVIDVALDTLLGPLLSTQHGPIVAQTLLSGLLSGLLGTANCNQRSDKTGVNVGALGFPASGIMGTGIEIALSASDAFGFLQTEILDRLTMPFVGYVSIRLCSQTHTLMGMHQFGDPCSVMIEVVGFGNAESREFIRQLQQRTLARIDSGLDAMLHWGLENDQLSDKHLRNIKALQKPTRSGMSKLDTFKAVRSHIQETCSGPYRVFDNAFTERLGLSRSVHSDVDISYLVPLLLDEQLRSTERITDVSYLTPLLLTPDSPDAGLGPPAGRRDSQKRDARDNRTL